MNELLHRLKIFTIIKKRPCFAFFFFSAATQPRAGNLVAAISTTTTTTIIIIFVGTLLSYDNPAARCDF